MLRLFAYPDLSSRKAMNYGILERPKTELPTLLPSCRMLDGLSVVSSSKFFQPANAAAFLAANSASEAFLTSTMLPAQMPPMTLHRTSWQRDTTKQSSTASPRRRRQRRSSSIEGRLQTCFSGVFDIASNDDTGLEQPGAYIMNRAREHDKMKRRIS